MSKKKIKKTSGFRFIGERVSNGNKKLDNLVKILFVMGLISLVFEIILYRKTIIELKIPLIIWLTPGILLTPLLYNRMNNIDGMKAHWTMHYVLHTCMTGAFILYAFMATNYYLANDSIETKSFKVIGTGSLPGPKYHRSEREPYVLINYEGMEKQLVFSYPETAKINSAQTATLRIKKGLWGYDILESYDAN
jgi:hypothetical protein